MKCQKSHNTLKIHNKSHKAHKNYRSRGNKISSTIFKPSSQCYSLKDTKKQHSTHIPPKTQQKEDTVYVKAPKSHIQFSPTSFFNHVDRYEHSATFNFINPHGLPTLASGLATISKNPLHQVNILLYGDLGTGKTTFSRVFLRELTQSPALQVVSPTFTIQQLYVHNRRYINHIDLYRLQISDEAHILGLPETYNDDCLIDSFQQLVSSSNMFPTSTSSTNSSTNSTNSSTNSTNSSTNSTTSTIHKNTNTTDRSENISSVNDSITNQHTTIEPTETSSLQSTTINESSDSTTSQHSSNISNTSNTTTSEMAEYLSTLSSNLPGKPINIIEWPHILHNSQYMPKSYIRVDLKDYLTYKSVSVHLCGKKYSGKYGQQLLEWLSSIVNQYHISSANVKTLTKPISFVESDEMVYGDYKQQHILQKKAQTFTPVFNKLIQRNQDFDDELTTPGIVFASTAQQPTPHWNSHPFTPLFFNGSHT